MEKYNGIDIRKILKKSSLGIITTPLLMEHNLWIIINKPFYGYMDSPCLFLF